MPFRLKSPIYLLPPFRALAWIRLLWQGGGYPFEDLAFVEPEETVDFEGRDEALFGPGIDRSTVLPEAILKLV